MNAVDEIVAQIPMGQLARQLGVDRSTAERAARQALPALLGGMEANARDPRGAASLEEALGQHQDSLWEAQDLDRVDTKDGDRIVGHIYGDKRGAVVDRLGGQGADEGLIEKLLPLLAPLVLSWLAQRYLGGGGPVQTVPSPRGGGGGLGDLLGSILGGGSGGGSGKGGADLITDILGGLLGGGRR